MLNNAATVWVVFVCEGCGYSFLVAPKEMGIVV